MPYTVPVSFDKFRENIEVSGDHRETASKRKDSIIGYLKNDFEILEAFPTGSIPRFTAVEGYADLDVIVVLHYTKHIEGKKPSEVLQSVRDVLSEYKTGARKNGQAVTLYYKTWPNVDIVPVARYIDAIGNFAYYMVPDMNTEKWIKSKPERHSENMLNKNRICGENFKRIVKMIKWWSKIHGDYFQSFHIETLAHNIFETLLSDYSWDIYTFFDKASQLIQSNTYYEGEIVDSYLDYTSRSELEKRLIKAKELSLDAWFATYNGKDENEKAIGIWRQIFGDKFPSYG